MMVLDQCLNKLVKYQCFLLILCEFRRKGISNIFEDYFNKKR